MSSDTHIFDQVKSIPDSGYLYKYVSVKRALEILLTQKVYFAHSSEFNDPFEGRFVHEHKLGEDQGISSYIHETDKTKKEYENIQEHLNEINLGFFSMSENWNSYPMWAHYANQHKGCCIRFNFSRWRSRYNWEESFPFMFTGKIDYIDVPLGYKKAINHSPHESGSIYMSKLENWGYEEEWRAVMYDGDYKHYETNDSIFDERILKHEKFEDMQGNEMYSLSKGLLDGIILGYNMGDIERESVFRAAQKHKIEVFEAKLAKYKFGMRLALFHI